MTIKRRFIKHLPLMLAGLAMGLGVFINNSSFKSNDSIETNASVGNYSTNASTYYNGITASSGKQLAAQLHDLITSTHKTYTTYADNGANLYQTHTDQYYENGNAISGYIYEFYSGVKWPSAWDANAGSTTGGYNREHCWCQSNSVPSGSSSQLWGENGGGADMHHLRPAENRLNSTRGNDKYGVVSSRDSYKVYAKYGSSTTYHGGYSNNSTFEPLDAKKGDVARIILYVYLHYNTYSNSTLFGSYGTTNGNGSSSYFATSLLPLTNIVKKDTEAQAIQLMLDWNTSDPVDEIEQRRNEQVAIYQGNRNPFIDNSNYANLIWGSGSSSSDPSATISPSSASVAVDGTVTLTATLSNVTSAGAITWTSSDESKAIVTKGNTSTTSSIATVTGVATGSATINCKYNGTTIGSVTVTVTSSGSSGGSSNEYSLYSGSITEGDYLIVYSNKAMNTTVSNNRLMFETVTPSSNKITTSNDSIVWHIVQNSSYWSLYNTTVEKYAAGTGTKNQAQLVSEINDYSKWTVSGTSTYEFVNKKNSDSSVNANLRENGDYGFACYATGTGGALSLYKKTESSSSKTLSSISLSDKTTSYYVGDEFVKPTVTAIYSDNTTANVTNSTTFTGYDLSATGTQTVTASYTYGGTTKTATYSITISAKPITSISASVSRTFYVGETITTSDITVVDNNGDSVNSFTFTNNNYQFTYADSNSGGTAKVKTFTDSISGAGKTCSLTVNVARAAYVAPTTVTDTITASDLPATGTTYTNFSNISKSSNAKYAGNSAKNSDAAIQMRTTNNNSGIVSTTSGGSVSSVTITVSSGTNTINVYGKNTAYSAASDLYSSSTQGTLVGSTSSTGTITFTTSYAYVGIRSSSGAIYLTSVAIKYGSDETAKNVANYIMYADTNNQCTTKLSIAVGYIKNMSSTEKSTFQTSNDYVISSARTRLEAWAANQGKTINYTSGTLGNASRLVPLENSENNNTIIMLIIVSMVGVTSIGACVYIRKKKSR